MKRILMTISILMGVLSLGFSQSYKTQIQEFKPGEKTYTSAEEQLLDAYQLNKPYGALMLDNLAKTRTGKTVYRLQQTYGGIPIANTVALVHVHNGFTERIISNWITRPVNVSTRASIQPEKAEQEALAFIKNNTAHLHSRQPPLLIWPQGGKWLLVYDCLVEIEEPYDVQRVLVNAHTGKVAYHTSTGHSCCTPATGELNFNGMQTITTDPFGAGFRLRGCLGNDGTPNCTNSVGVFRTVLNNANTDFTNPTTSWTGFPLDTPERCALDAHWGTEVTFNYFLNTSSLGQNIFYGAPEFLNVLRTSLTNNAIYYNGLNRIHYGHTTNSNEYWTSLDIVAHELTHGVTSNNSNLVYQGESGAINEALSDIYAMAIEAQFSSLDWLVGDDMITLRSFINPGAFGQPDTYQGFNWATGSDDNGGVHTNSGVINYWFYLLVAGGAGTNDIGNAYQVNGIGMADAMRLVDMLQGQMMTPTTDMHEMRRLALLAAGELWTFCSANYIAVVNAFYAVGIGEPFGAHDPIEVSWETDITSCSATLHWDDVSAQQYLVSYWPVGNQQQTQYETTPINEITLHNLLPNTAYNWTVTAQCEDYLIANDILDSFTTTNDCPALHGLKVSDVTVCSAVLSWQDIGVWQYRIDYHIQGSQTILSAHTNEADIVLSNLLPNTTYVATVTPMCGDQCTGQSLEVTFTTLGCGPLQNLKIDNNPCYFTLKWDLIENQEYWIEGTFTDEWGFTAPLSSSGDFFGSYAFIHSFTPGTKLSIDVRITCLGDGCEIQTVEHFDFDVPAETGECEAPTNISVQYINGGRIISWDGPNNGNGLYNYEIIDSGNNIIDSGNNWYSNSVVSSVPAPDPCYTVRVQAVCGCGEDHTLSDWAEQYICPPCEPPLGMNVYLTCGDVASIQYVPTMNGQEYQVRYWANNNPNDVFTIPNVPYYDDIFDLFDLLPGTTYTVELTTICDQHNISTPIFLEFTTDPLLTCNAPVNITHQTINANTVRLQWDAVPGADYYEVQYRIGSGAWTTLQVLNNYVEITGLILDGCVSYTARIRTRCNLCWYGLSAYSPLYYFPECMPPGLHIGMEAGQACNPCTNNCYVCIVDGNGQKINTYAATQGYWYSITWIVPLGYPTPGTQLINRECINMGPAQIGQTFTATVRKMCTIEGAQVAVCTQVITYTHNCFDGGGGGGLDGGHLAQNNTGLPHTDETDSNTPVAPSFKVFPNPGAQQFQLVNPNDAVYAGEVFDTYGRKWHTLALDAGQSATIQTTDWPSGVYFIAIKTNEGAIINTLKWVKL